MGADEIGFLYGSAQIFFFVLAVGAFITVTMKTESIQTGIGRLALRFRHTPALLVIVLMSVFALGGTTYGMWEETLGFFVLMVPLTLALGYDRLVAVSIIFLGAGTGVLASTVNPFATGVASDAAGIDISDGLGLRLVMFIVLVPLAALYVLRYGARVRKDPSRSLLPPETSPVGDVEEVAAAHGPAEGDPGRLLRCVRDAHLRLRALGRRLEPPSSTPTSRCPPSATSTSPRRRSSSWSPPSSSGRSTSSARRARSTRS